MALLKIGKSWMTLGYVLLKTQMERIEEIQERDICLRRKLNNIYDREIILSFLIKNRKAELQMVSFSIKVQYFFYPNYQVIQGNYVILQPFLFGANQVQNFIEQSGKFNLTQNMQSTLENVNNLQQQLSEKREINVNQFATRITLETENFPKEQDYLQSQQKLIELQKEVVKSQLVHGKKKKPMSELFFGIEWKNQNRNIIPNIMNQLLSYILKRNKSQFITDKVFQTLPHPQEWTPSKYYYYVKKMKSRMGNYISQTQLINLTEIQEPEFIIYSRKEQEFYLKVCRIAVQHFLNNQSPLISLTSKKMSQSKRKAHLTAKRALKIRFREILREKMC